MERFADSPPPKRRAHESISSKRAAKNPGPEDEAPWKKRGAADQLVFRVHRNPGEGEAVRILFVEPV
ncbi:MAG TPA: hypothetical protein VII38_10145, partial [Polyangia bacterium]